MLITLSNFFETLSKYGISKTTFFVILGVVALIVLLVINKLRDKDSEQEYEEYEISQSSAFISKTVSASKPQTTNQSAVSGEVIAAISAAVAMMYDGSGKHAVIRSVKPANKAARPIWGQVGVQNNTKAF